MGNRIVAMLWVILFVLSFVSNAQNNPSASFTNSEEHSTVGNNEKNPCIPADEYKIIEKRCADNFELLGMKNTANPMMTVALDWPLQATANLTDCSYYHISAYVDHNSTAGVFQDFNCGTNSYDGHGGTDISTWPFNFYKMDNSLVEVIAAAPGIIIDKHDGEFDRNCTSNNLTANYVIVQHADGSYALYWHMKNGSVTSVAIGQPVLAGEYLGVVGSSGSASGPHLHFEVWSGSTSATRVDPYSGACNSLNVSSWWVSQKPHKETGVVRASAHTTDIVVPPCPTTETLNEGASFQIPFQGAGLPPGYAKFYIFIRDEVAGLTGNLSIRNPNGTTYLSWTYTSPSDSKVRTWGWSKVLPTISGTYTFQAIYNGITCSSTFEIVNPAGIDDINMIASTKIFPNPASNEVVISGNGYAIESVEIFNIPGEKVLSVLPEIKNQKTEMSVDIQALEPGIYFVKMKIEEYFLTKKLIVAKE